MQRRLRGLVPVVAAVLVLAFASLVGMSGNASAADTRTPGEVLRGAKSWGYQLQRPDVARLSASPYDVLVIDYSRDGSEAERFTPAELARLKVKPDGSRRVVLAYLSIGEAETYRFYWHWTWGGRWYTGWLGLLLAPSWIGPANAEWGGNYAVRYWDPGWQAILLGTDGYVERIVAAGFDGVWLDKVDSSIEPIARRRKTAQNDMRALVAQIAGHGRKLRPGFLVVPQNGEELLVEPAYRAVIDGLGKEDLLYGEFHDREANPEEVIEKRIALLRLLAGEGKSILAVEYIDEPARIDAARRRLSEVGLVPHFADRPLDNLRVGDYPPVGRPPRSEAHK